MKIALLLPILFCCSGCYLMLMPDRLMEEDLSKLDVNHFKKKMTIKDDNLERVIQFSTVRGYRKRWGLLGVHGTDEYLRGFLDKSTGKSVFQVFAVLKYRDSGFRSPNEVNFGQPLSSAHIQRLHFDVDCHDSQSLGGCAYSEEVIFEVPEDEFRRLQELSAAGEPINGKVWSFRLKSRHGRDYDGDVLYSEILALLEVMDSYKAPGPG